MEITHTKLNLQATEYSLPSHIHTKNMHAIIIWSACERWALFDFVIMVQCTSKCVHSPPNISRKFPSFIVNREKTINRTGVIGLIIIPSWPNKTLLHILWQHKLFNLNILLGLGQILPGNFTSSQKKSTTWAVSENQYTDVFMHLLDL